MKNKVIYFSIKILVICLLISCQKEPTASFSASKSVVSPNELILFTNSTTDGDHYTWEFGDGSTSNEKNPTHLYSLAGDYIVTLTAYNKKGRKSNSVSTKISVGLSPVCSFSYTPKYPKPNENVQFTDNSTNTPISWEWNFGDGSTSTLKSPTHSFSSEQTYSVTLKVTNNFGTSTLTSSVLVTNNPPPPPVAGFTYADNGNLNVSFTDQSTGNPTSWYWTFGDGSTSTTQNPTHQYAQTGSYTVSLKVTNAAGYNQISKTIILGNYDFLVGNYSVVDYANGYTSNYTDNITKDANNSSKFWTQKFGNYTNAIVYFTVSSENITIPSQTVVCGMPPNNIPHTFDGNGYYTHNGNQVMIYITYNDNSSYGYFTNCTGTYTKTGSKILPLENIDKSKYMFEHRKN